MTAAPDFRLYASNSLEVLAGLLAEALREPAPGQPLLAPDVVLIPQVAMRRWLQAHLAERHGVVANIEFLAPGEFVARALEANLGPGADLDATALHWRLYRALHDPQLRALPAMAGIDAYLSGDDPLRAWTLAHELGVVFEKYQAWRRDWLLRWEAGADPDDPQAILWRHVAGGLAHRARRIQDYLDRYGRADGPLPAGLPPRLFAFATLNVSPDVLRVLATQARVGTLHFYLPTPSREYWGDLDTAREAEENPLLRAWGYAGRDFMALLGGYEVVHPSLEVPAWADPAEGAHGQWLLQRLQSDLFHRRATPGAPARPQVDRADPSLQLHACHTRLRELQGLADQLRGLFADPRFDPPLQPREVAVLAPDIDPYLPYLEAVFGRRGQEDAIPYALADASPLANEPLAEVFLRLLALPVSRFGLHEVLDLLASPAPAEANGLAAPALERLQAWLEQAGARWGIDAAHRTGFDAPADAAYTWAFALDRLLLGHASGSDAPIVLDDGQVLAPLPQLEGSALDVLDTCIRLLRELARHARVLGQPMPPAQWRERLLGLLDALLPRPPSGPSPQRALDRLRTLIDEFARGAAAAGFDAPVPPEAVRAHFAAVLGEADTRAPLLTGGVSIARMVPMRLLPFRVICVLGMNDGDFPRRDPSSGLNRLTAELGSGRRRHGDRSTRDDDRFLFLQLLASAQDVFYVSWIGADPRDGSEREPSVLVSELIDAAARQHADPRQAARELVVHHPLQPFSPAAFGAGEPRRFSSRRDWREAAAQPAAQRTPLPPWFPPGTRLAPPPDADADAEADTVPLEALRRFLRNPAHALARHMGLRLPEVEARREDVEPLAEPSAPLERAGLRQAVFAALLQGQDMETLHATLRARALLPSGAPGRRVLARQCGQLAPWREVFAAWRGDASARSVVVEADIDGVRVHGRIEDVYPHGIARVRLGAMNGPAAVRHGLDWLLASAAGLALPLVEFHEVRDRDGLRHGPFERAPLPAAQARAALARLLSLRVQGLAEPLLFAPYSSWEIYANPGYDKGVAQARKRWHGTSGPGFAEGADPAWRLLLRGRDPFAEPELLLRFVRAAEAVFLALVEGRVAEVEAGPEDLAGLVLATDEEEAA
ncbi:exodeoxyribonuclease V subunit gamma [Pseudoxanthomonas taiwanensis]|uniref:RecBCD enzyme subunit RecC n=1 Tax=Pseudoxanthomonas taiwanensis TaxID=176598 RepID=A0A921TFL4_9GAMM|nr:exodeoxyribonuclease V subunit gamma [Pseudoxanthomonas taiwanensis]KAF1688619.1 exodeoxyribonuclease V subunit gamma [Pseudoxanthomonas taiwanensis]